MSIPLATTTITVERRQAPASDDDPWDTADDTAADEFVPVAQAVRAVISVRERQQPTGPGDSESVTFSLQCDPCDLTYLDQVTDDNTGQAYEVAWAVELQGVAGLSSVKAGLTTRKGLGQA